MCVSVFCAFLDWVLGVIFWGIREGDEEVGPEALVGQKIREGEGDWIGYLGKGMIGFLGNGGRGICLGEGGLGVYGKIWTKRLPYTLLKSSVPNSNPKFGQPSLILNI